MAKLDYKKEYKQLYNTAQKGVTVVEVPEFNYIMTDGEGDPNSSPLFQEAASALFSVSYTLKFMIKKGPTGVDYGVMPLEGQWWTDNMSEFNMEDKSNWKWTLMILQPEFVTRELFEKAAEEVRLKKKIEAVGRLRFESLKEGLCAQIVHIGPFSGEGPTVAKLHEYMRDNGYDFNGKHREIYTSDINKAAPENWKTIIRQPVRKLS